MGGMGTAGAAPSDAFGVCRGTASVGLKAKIRKNMAFKGIATFGASGNAGEAGGMGVRRAGSLSDQEISGNPSVDATGEARGSRGLAGGTADTAAGTTAPSGS